MWRLRVPVCPRATCHLRSPCLFILVTSMCSSDGLSGHYTVEPCAVPFSESTLDISLSSWR